MKKIILYSATILISISLWSCSTKGPNLNPEPNRSTFKDAPDWFNEKPKKEGYIYTSSLAESRNYQSSLTKAAAIARRELATTLESEVNALTDLVNRETGSGIESEFITDFKETTQVIVSNTLQGAEVVKQQTIELKTDGGKIFRSWVLLEYDKGYQQKKLLDAIKADKILSDKLEASELVKEMEDKVEAYRKRKGQ